MIEVKVHVIPGEAVDEFLLRSRFSALDAFALAALFAWAYPSPLWLRIVLSTMAFIEFIIHCGWKFRP